MNLNLYFSSSYAYLHDYTFVKYIIIYSIVYENMYNSKSKLFKNVTEVK